MTILELVHKFKLELVSLTLFYHQLATKKKLSILMSLTAYGEDQNPAITLNYTSQIKNKTTFEKKNHI